MYDTIDELLHRATPPLQRPSFGWTIGTRPLPLNAWLNIRPDREHQLREKERLLEVAPSKVLVSLPHQSAAANALLEQVVSQLLTYHSDVYRRESDAILDIETGRLVTIDLDAPLATLARLTPEDFVIMGKVGGAWTMTAACVCFTSRWSLDSKLGLNVNQIHSHVPAYQERLATSVERIFDRIDATEILERKGWTLLDTEELHLPGAKTTEKSRTAMEVLRIERQTLRRLDPETVVFGIGTHVVRLSQLEPAVAQRLVDLASHADEQVLRYKGWDVSGEDG